MSALFRKVCSLFIVGVPEGRLARELRLLVAKGAGVILFSRNVSNWREGLDLIRQLNDCAKPRRPLVCIDQEGGRVQRLGPPFIQLPPMEVLGGRGDPSLCRRLARQLGAELRAAGIWLNFAPVLDCNTNPANPVIGDRSFGGDPALVAKMGLAFTKGLQAAGVAACGKHLPGHGDTDSDSHLCLPKVAAGLQLLRRRELVPFMRVAGSVWSMMMAHLLVPSLDPELPASLSPVAYRRLRRLLRFDRPMVTDDLEMKAVADSPGVVEAAAAAIGAGADGVLVCHSPALALQSVEEVCRRVESGAIPERRIETAIGRWRRLRRRFLRGPMGPDLRWLKRLWNSPVRRSLDRELGCIGLQGR